MAETGSVLSPEDLYIGMEIKEKQQLHNIYDIWIILVWNSDLKCYTIGFIGKETNSESDALFTHKETVCPVYNDSSDYDEHICYIG